MLHVTAGLDGNLQRRARASCKMREGRKARTDVVT
jgi:hypothetical protein